MKKKLVVLISNAGTGTNLQALIDAIESHTLNAEIVVVISGSSKAYGIQRAERHGIPSRVVSKKENVLAILQMYHPDYIVLAGWQRIIPDEIIELFPNQIINIHPGLIPDSKDQCIKNPDSTDGLWNKGKMTEAAIENFLSLKATYAGSSIHFLSKELDFGPVLNRIHEKIKEDDTVESLYTRLKKKEHEILITSLQKICNN